MKNRRIGSNRLDVIFEPEIREALIVRAISMGKSLRGHLLDLATVRTDSCEPSRDRRRLRY